MNLNHLSVVSILLSFCLFTDALWKRDAVQNGEKIAELKKTVDSVKKSVPDSHNGITQAPDQASRPFDCSAIPISNKLFNLSALNRDWKVVSDTDGMLFNPCGSLTYSNAFCPAKQTSLCLLEKSGGDGIASFGAKPKVLLSPKGIYM